jgi:prephenate dehydrogenase
MKFGIVGYGRFGQLWAKALLPFGEVMVYEKNALTTTENNGIKISTLEEVAQADVVFLLTPISEFERSCEEIKPLLNAKTLVLDCCSVKTHPAAIMQKTFAATQPLLATHPLFGPDSAKRSAGFAGHKIAICPIQCSENQQQEMETLFRNMGLQVFVTTPDEHDREMASSQGLVHFIGRGLAALDLQPQDIATPDFQALLNINTMVINDTWRLFLDMHQYNPYTKQIRKKFVHQLMKLDQAIDDAKN